jgi:hypothetical protein
MARGTLIPHIAYEVMMVSRALSMSGRILATVDPVPDATIVAAIGSNWAAVILSSELWCSWDILCSVSLASGKSR